MFDLADAHEAVKEVGISAEKALPRGINGYHAACILAPGIIIGAAASYSSLLNQ